jgi:hypothetical protein
MTSSSIGRKLVLSLTLGVFAACSASDITAPRLDKAPSDSTANILGLFGPPRLLWCPTSETASNSGLVDALGGVVSAGGTTITIPAGALLGPTNVTVTVPASNYMEVDISVEGADHFLFELPVAVTVSYARCASFRTFFGFVKAWHIDSETKALLEAMPSVDDKVARSVTFTTGHLSGYALAN